MSNYINLPDMGNAHWKSPAASFATLPSTGNNIGDVRVTLDTFLEYIWNGSAWVLTSGNGDIVGPASATDNAIARFDGTTGKLLQNSAVTIDDGGSLLFSSGSIGADGASRPVDVRASGVILGGDGTAANPSLGFDSDEDTGIYHYAANSIGIGTGGTAKWHITSPGHIIPEVAGAIDLGSAANYMRVAHLKTCNVGSDATNQAFTVDGSVNAQAGNTSCQAYILANDTFQSTAGAAANLGLGWVSGSQYFTYFGITDATKYMSLFAQDGGNSFTAVELLRFDNTPGFTQMNLLFKGAAGGTIGADGADRPSAIYCSGKVAAGDGAAATPSHTFDSDEDTGLFRQAANIISIAAAGAEQIRVDGGTSNTTLRTFSSSSTGKLIFGTAASAPYIKLGSISSSVNELSLVAPATSANDSRIGIQLGATPLDAFYVDLRAGEVQANVNVTLGGFTAFYNDNLYDFGTYSNGSNARPRDIFVGTSVKNAAGTSSLPSYTFSADTDTGMFRSAANILSFSTSGTQQIDILSGGALQFNTNASLSSTTDAVQLGGYDISAGNRTLAISTETAVAADVGLVSTSSLTVRINGTNYKIPLTTA